MTKPRCPDERHVSLYGDVHGNWPLTTTPTGTIPPPHITLSVYEDGPPPPTRTLTYLGDPADLVITLYCRIPGSGTEGRGGVPAQQQLADLMGVGQTAVSRYIRQLSIPDLADQGWRNLVKAAMTDWPRAALGRGLCEIIGSVEPEYFAPARFVLTVLHRKGDAPGHPVELTTAEPIDGWTMCGRAMLSSELWRPVDSREGDQLCAGCLPAGCGAGVQPDLQEATLW